MRTNHWLEHLDLFRGDFAWVVHVVLIVAAALVADTLQRLLLARVHRHFARTRSPWDDALVLSLKSPASLLIWTLGITLAFQTASGIAPTQFLDYMPALRSVGVVAATAWFLLSWVKNAEAILLTEGRIGSTPLDPSTIQALRKLSTLAVWVVASIVALQTLGFNLTAVLTMGGIGGIAIGFAARDVIGNFFGGLMLYLTQPFTPGEWIRSPDKNVEGTVEEIGWYLTRIRTFDLRPLYVPNSIFTQIAVENPSRMMNRRIYETIGIRYDDFSKMGAITEEVRAMLENHPDIDPDRTLMVNFDTYGASSLDFFVYTFTKTKEWARFHAEIGRAHV